MTSPYTTRIAYLADAPYTWHVLPVHVRTPQQIGEFLGLRAIIDSPSHVRHVPVNAPADGLRSEAGTPIVIHG